MPEHPLSTLEKLDPRLMNHLRETNELIYSPGALPSVLERHRAADPSPATRRIDRLVVERLMR
jgi:hypothetical protein